jgi:hypothetical protein
MSDKVKDVDAQAAETGDDGEQVLTQEVALYERSQRDLITTLQGQEQAIEIVKRRGELLDTAYYVGLKRTRPTDWVVSRTPDGKEIATLCASGAHAIAPVYGIRIQDVRPQNNLGEFLPREEKAPNGARVLRAWCDAFCGMTGGHVEALEASRRSDEDFTGRSVDEKGNIVRRDGVQALDSDLRAAVWTLLFTKAVRVLAGMSKVPVAHLAKAWDDTDKTVADIPKGHGYGSSTERKAEDASDEDVASMREALTKRMLSFTGGDSSEASALLVTLTSNPDKNFKGFSSVGRLTKKWQFDRCNEKLAKMEQEMQKS